jgi:hypothetical protein
VARGIFGNISKTRGHLKIFVDCGLITKKSRGLFANFLGKPVDYGSWTSATGRGVHRESISGLTGARVAVWRAGNGGEETTEEALGAGNAWARRDEKESGERCGKDQAVHRPFIGGRTAGMHRGFMAGINASA